ncbi:hypothetical protein H9W95_10325 [Flavobacterium lindanitolerans]|nr:hypothetical protein [Flavobacterium lindanitolerans]
MGVARIQQSQKINLTTHTKKEIGLPKGFKIEYMKEKSPDELWMGSNKGMYVFSKKRNNQSF